MSMWPITVVLAIPAAVATLVLTARFVSDRRYSERPQSFVDLILGWCERVAGVPAIRWATLALVVTFLGVAAINFFASNTLSWGLAFNWALGLAIVAAIGSGLWFAWQRFDSIDWTIIRRWTLAMLGVVWLVLVALVALTPPSGSGNDFNAFEAAAIVTLLVWLWVPFVGLPIGLAAGLLVSALTRAHRSRDPRPAPAL